MPEGEYLQYGGQAIVEGVMMRSPRYFAVACRAPNQEIILRCEPVAKTWIGRQKWLKKPFLRGSLALFDAMALGYRALRFATDVQLAPQYQPKKEGDSETSDSDAKDAERAAQATVSGRVQDISVGLSLVVGMLIGLFIFVYLPNLLAQFLQARGWNGTQINALAGVLKVFIFFAYLTAIGQLDGIREVFKYHGAEHKAINTLEAEKELTMGNCLEQTRLHPRCGTSFAIIVLIISIVVFTFVPRYPLGPDNGIFLNVTIRVFLEILILPLIAGVSYEVIRLAGKFKNSGVTKTLLWPGLMSQYITTREPQEKHIEVALAALQAVVDAEAAEAAAKAAPVESQVDEAAAEIA